MTVDIFLHGFNVSLPDGVDPSDEEAVYRAVRSLVSQWLRDNADAAGFEFELYPGEEESSVN